LDELTAATQLDGARCTRPGELVDMLADATTYLQRRAAVVESDERGEQADLYADTRP
jgi:hypothetical protein